MALRAKLKQIVEQSDTRAGRAFDHTIEALIVLSLVSFSLETLPNLPSGFRTILGWIELGTVAVFTTEYLLRLYLADRRLKFATSFFGVIDLLAILPYYLMTGLDLRAVRVFRFLRLFRAFKLLRYGEAMDRFRLAFRIAKEELLLFFFISCLLLFLSAVGIYYFEHPAQPELFASVFHSLWWAVVTLTTVGYGDIYPVTAGGKFFTFFVLIIGLSIFAVPAGIIASALTEARKRSRPESEGQGS